MRENKMKDMSGERCSQAASGEGRDVGAARMKVLLEVEGFSQDSFHLSLTQKGRLSVESERARDRTVISGRTGTVWERHHGGGVWGSTKMR